MKRIHTTYSEKEDFNAYSLFKEYSLFGSTTWNGTKYYYILKNRGNVCQQIYWANEKEITKAKESHVFKPNLHTLVNDYLVDSEILDEVLEELDIHLTANKYNL